MRARRPWLLAASYYFYMCWNAQYALLIAASTLVTYLCALALGLGIFIAAVFPVGALMFLVTFLLIFCGIGCLRRF